jgi:hypothetical protein
VKTASIEVRPGSKLVPISGNSVKVPIAVKAPITKKVSFFRSCVQIANAPSNITCAKSSPMGDVKNVSLDLRSILMSSPSEFRH